MARSLPSCRTSTHALTLRTALVAALGVGAAALLNPSASHGQPRDCRAAIARTMAPASSATSTYCLGCHDGSVAVNVGSSHERKGELGTLHSGSSGGHPVGLDYLEAFNRAPSRLRPPSQLDPRVTLRRGRVECASCHDTTASARGMLVLPNGRSALCLACHAL